MDRREPTPPTTVGEIPPAVVIDTSPLISMGNPTATTHQAIASVFNDADATAYIPQSVKDEFQGTGARAYDAPARIHGPMTNGWMETAPPFSGGASLYNGPSASEIADETMRRLSDITQTDPDKIKTTDTLLPGVAVQLLAGASLDQVGVLMDDGRAENAILETIEGTLYEDKIRLLQWDPFESFVLEYNEFSPTDSDPGIY